MRQATKDDIISILEETLSIIEQQNLWFMMRNQLNGKRFLQQIRQHKGNPPTGAGGAIMDTELQKTTLIAGTVIKIAGLPLRLLEDVEIETHPATLGLLKEALAKQAHQRGGQEGR